jgi:hypothetical protein
MPAPAALLDLVSRFREQLPDYYGLTPAEIALVEGA